MRRACITARTNRFKPWQHSAQDLPRAKNFRKDIFPFMFKSHPHKSTLLAQDMTTDGNKNGKE